MFFFFSWEIKVNNSKVVEYSKGRINSKGIEFLPQTKIFWFQYLCNLMVQTFDISNLDYFIYKY